MEQLYYVGLDIHKRSINYCVKDQRGEIVGEGRMGASRGDLEQWRRGLPEPWVGRWKRPCSPAGSTIS